MLCLKKIALGWGKSFIGGESGRRETKEEEVPVVQLQVENGNEEKWVDLWSNFQVELTEPMVWKTESGFLDLYCWIW